MRRITIRRIGVGGSVSGIGRRHPLDHPQHGFDEGVHMAEVALHAAVGEDVDRPILEDRPGVRCNPNSPGCAVAI